MVVNVLTLCGMIRSDVLFELDFHADRAVGRAGSVPGRLLLYSSNQAGIARRATQRSEVVNVLQEVLTSIRVVKAFAREDFEQERFERQSRRPSKPLWKQDATKAKAASESWKSSSPSAPVWCFGMARVW